MGLLHKSTFFPRFIRQFIFLYLNRLIFWSAGVNFGKGLRIYNQFNLKKYSQSTFTIGDNCLFFSGDAINPISRNIKGCIFLNHGADLKIGNNVGMSSPCIWCDKKISIGNNVKIGGLVTILDTDCHSLNFNDRRMAISDSENTKSSPVVIEDDVLLGANSIVLKGVTIGARSVIGAGSVVTNNIPPDCVAAGNPCRVIKPLNNTNSL